VIAGEYKGRALKPIPGTGTRPTTDRVKEAWASTLGSLLPGGFAGKQVLDAFAGSGALGIEALSRGAATCTFFERDRRAFQILSANTAFITPRETRLALRQADITRASRETAFINRRAAVFDLLILDPPYDLPACDVAALIQRLLGQELLSDTALISYEHRASSADGYALLQCEPAALAAGAVPAISALPQLEPLAYKRYGNSVLEYHGLSNAGRARPQLQTEGQDHDACVGSRHLRPCDHRPHRRH
jgi:16S rRNA (guanine966-N2)-methyltransferase